MVQIQKKGKAKKGGDAKIKKQVKPPPPPKEESSDDEESSEEEVEEGKVTPVEKVEKQVDETDSEDDDDENEEKGQNGKAKKAAKQADDDDDDEEDEDDDDSEEDDDDEDDDDSDEEEAKPAKAQGKKVTGVAKEEEEEDDDEEDSDDDEEDDDEDEEKDVQMEEDKNNNRKRKQKTEETVSQKKQKTDSEAQGDTIVTMMFMNLPDGTDDKSFNKFLNSKGIQCKSCRANYGRGKAFVDIAVGDKGKAIVLNEVEWKGNELSVKEAEPRNQGQDGGSKQYSDRDARTMFVRNLPYSAAQDDIQALFENVEEVRLIFDRNTGRNKGIAFVQFNDGESLDVAMKNKDDYELDGRQLEVDYTDSRSKRPSGGRGGGRGRGGDGGRGGGGRFGGGGRGGGRDNAPSSTLFVKGVTEDMSRDDLSKYFEGASDVRMITDKETGKNKFFCYVEYGSADQAQEVFRGSKGGIETEDGSTTFIVDYARDKRRDDGGFGGRGRGGRGGRGGGFRGRGGGGGFRGRGGRGGGRGGFGRGGGGGGGGGKKTTFDDSD